MRISRRVVVLFSMLGVLLFSAQGWSDELMARLTDNDVKALAKTLGKQHKSFVGALDSKFKRSILRGPGGEIQVEYYLTDLSESIQQLSERFTGSYSASAEATEVLKRADFMNSYVRNNPSMKGANEWDVFGASLQQLASAYGTSFPLPGDEAIRRIGDKELADAAAAVSKFAKDLPKPIRKETRGMKELSDTVKMIEAELKSMSTLSKTLGSRIRSGKPATAEARQLMESVHKVEALIATEGMPAGVSEAWATGSRDIRKIAQTFRL